MKSQQYTIGIDLGGTNTEYALVDKSGNILRQGKFPTVTPTIEEWADTLAKHIKNITSEGEGNINIDGIGIGAPCANTETGTIEGATDLPWQSPIPLRELIEERTGLPVTVGNDANAAAIGEMAYGSARGLRNFIVLTLGTGVGSGIVCDGHLLTGARGFAGELGHVTFPFAADRDCGCGRKGCLQTIASAKGILETARRLLSESDQPSLLRNIDTDSLSAKTIAEAANKGDLLANEIFEFTGNCIGKACAEFAAFTDPDAIIFFGGVSQAGELLLHSIRESFKEHALFLYRDRVEFTTSGLPDAKAALLGAAALPYLHDK